MENDKIETVDQLVEFHLDAPNDIKFTCYYIVTEHPNQLLTLLKSSINKPSIYDLYIIKGIELCKMQKTGIHKAILDVYKHRKGS